MSELSRWIAFVVLAVVAAACSAGNGPPPSPKPYEQTFGPDYPPKAPEGQRTRVDEATISAGASMRSGPQSAGRALASSCDKVTKGRTHVAEGARNVLRCQYDQATMVVSRDSFPQKRRGELVPTLL